MSRPGKWEGDQSGRYIRSKSFGKNAGIPRARNRVRMSAYALGSASVFGAKGSRCKKG